MVAQIEMYTPASQIIVVSNHRETCCRNIPNGLAISCESLVFTNLLLIIEGFLNLKKLFHWLKGFDYDLPQW